MKKSNIRKPAAPRRNPCRAVVAIDGAPVRQKVRKEYEKVRRDLDRCREDLARFETQDRPRFGQWVHRKWGALMTQIRDITQQLSAKERLVREIETEVFFTGDSYARAFRRVTGERAASGSDQAENRQEAEDDSGESSDREGARSGQSSGEDPWNKDFEEMGEDFADGFGAAERSRPGRPRPDDAFGEPRLRRLKELYRALVRRLHPDTQCEMTGETLERWHQAQEAYQKRDVEQLEVLLTLCEIEDRGTTSRTSVSLLMRITQQFAATLRVMKRQLSKCRHDPAWKFGVRQDLPALAVATERRLRQELRVFQEELERVESLLRHWEAQANRSPRRRSPVRKARIKPQAEFFF